MSILLMHIYGNRSFNRSIFRPHLYIYDDIMIYKRRSLFSAGEVTLSYNMVAQVILKKFPIFFAHLEIITTGADTEISVRWTSKSKAIKAKKIIDKKVHQTYGGLMGHQTPQQHNLKEHNTKTIDDFEKSLHRLNELLNTGRISKREFNQQKKRLLKKHH